jgi:hypothetical protein
VFVILPTKKALQISPLHIPHKCPKHLQDFRGNLQGNFLGDFRGNFRGDFRGKKNVRVTPVLDLSCWPFLNLWAGLLQTSETKMLEYFAGEGLLGAAARLHHVRRVQEDRAGDEYRGGAGRGVGMTERVRGEEGI